MFLKYVIQNNYEMYWQYNIEIQYFDLSYFKYVIKLYLYPDTAKTFEKISITKYFFYRYLI